MDNSEQELKILEEIHKLLLHTQLNGPLDPKPAEILNTKLAELLAKHMQLSGNVPATISKPKTASHPLAKYDPFYADKVDLKKIKGEILSKLEYNLDEKQIDYYLKRFELPEIYLLYDYFRKICENTKGDTIEKNGRKCKYITVANLKQLLFHCGIYVDSVMKSLMKPLKGTGTVLFENFLESFNIFHKLKPKEYGFLKLKVFAYLCSSSGKGTMNKQDLEKSIYYACLDNRKKLDKFYWKHEAVLAGKGVLLAEDDSEILLTNYYKCFG